LSPPAAHENYTLSLHDALPICNADNVPFIGKSDPNGNPVRLAKATGHVSNYAEDKVAAYTLPDPLVTASGERVTTPQMWLGRRRSEEHTSELQSLAYLVCRLLL